MLMSHMHRVTMMRSKATARTTKIAFMATMSTTTITVSH